VKFRFTIKELEEKNDDTLLYDLVTERLSLLKNPYTPLRRRLEALQEKLRIKIIPKSIR